MTQHQQAQANSYVVLNGITDNGTLIRYDHFVHRLFKSGAACGDLVHAAMGISGESGELLDAIKKHVVYGKELDRINVIEELGDLTFYIHAMMNLLGISEQQVLQHNACKLQARYESMSYSDEAAQARQDKVTPQVGAWGLPVQLTELSIRAMDDTAGLEAR